MLLLAFPCKNTTKLRLEILYVLIKAKANLPQECMTTNPFRENYQNTSASVRARNQLKVFLGSIQVYSIAVFFINKVLKGTQNVNSIKTTCFISLVKICSLWYGYVS